MNTSDKEYIPIRYAVQLTGLTSQTLRTWAKNGKIKTFQTATGQYLFHRPSIIALINGSTCPVEEKKNVIYCRVSSKKQLDDLHRQTEELKNKYPDYELITDCASGINFKRKGFQTILGYALQRNLKELVVAHRDRLSRFGFDLLKTIIEQCGGLITVLDDRTGKSTEQELAEDLLSIVHIYTCRQMGKRRYNRKELENTIKTLIRAEDTVNEVDPHIEVCIQQDSTCN